MRTVETEIDHQVDPIAKITRPISLADIQTFLHALKDPNTPTVDQKTYQRKVSLNLFFQDPSKKFPLGVQGDNLF